MFDDQAHASMIYRLFPGASASVGGGVRKVSTGGKGIRGTRESAASGASAALSGNATVMAMFLSGLVRWTKVTLQYLTLAGTAVFRSSLSIRWLGLFFGPKAELLALTRCSLERLRRQGKRCC